MRFVFEYAHDFIEEFYSINELYETMMDWIESNFYADNNNMIVGQFFIEENLTPEQ